ncbi:hypothetical protein [Trichothermofontia sp.]
MTSILKKLAYCWAADRASPGTTLTMNQPCFWKNLPAPVRMLVRPMLLLAVGLHVLILLLPLPSKPEPEPEPEPELLLEEQTIKVVPAPNRAIAPPPPKPTAPPPAVTPAPTRPAPSPPRSQPTSPPIVASPPPLVSDRPAPAPSPSPAEPEAVPSPPAIALTPATPEPTAPEAEVTGAFDDFPNPEGVVAGCLGLSQCQQAEGVRLTRLVQDLPAALERQGYTVTALDLDSDQGRRVFEVTKGDEKRYLNLFSTPEGAVYLLAKQILTLADVRAMAASRQALVSLVQGVSKQQAGGQDFIQPDAFFTERGLREGLEPFFPLVANQTPDRLFSTQLAPQLQQQGFTVAPLPDYGGGPLYQVQQGVLVYYLNLIPAAGERGAIVTLWSQLPNIKV